MNPVAEYAGCRSQAKEGAVKPLASILFVTVIAGAWETERGRAVFRGPRFPYSLTSLPCIEDRCWIRMCRNVGKSGTSTKHAARQKAGRQVFWLPDENMFPGSGVSRHFPDVFWQQQAGHNENRRCGPHKEDAGRNGGVLDGSGKRCAGERKKWQRMAFEAPLYHLFDPNS